MRFFLLTLIFSIFLFGCENKPVSYPSGSIETSAYFSPKGGCTREIVNLINHSHRNIDIAIYSFTSRRIAKALIDAHNRGVKVRVIIDEGNGKSRFCVGPLLQSAGIEVRYKRGSGGGLMHNKYAIYDNKIVSTGSFNWTGSAERRNDENLVVIKNNGKLIKLYRKNFEKLWKLAGLTN
ncbi:PLD-like domain-containing protein [Balnearium lithotrophicum]|uniref:phospholipase D n=1 Tax=Balnearium lithotrophicum TaxID=223788 RepID=A0A521BIS6_9BACT|nr:phospholipase D family protein [Balnearium lithotrophicum]SMO46995.1 PLD-like domain-containing protein [Balnearium lithotrophicum]